MLDSIARAVEEKEELRATIVRLEEYLSKLSPYAAVAFTNTHEGLSFLLPSNNDGIRVGPMFARHIADAALRVLHHRLEQLMMFLNEVEDCLDAAQPPIENPYTEASK